MKNYTEHIKSSCPYHLPWVDTAHGERNNMCICEQLRFSKECDDCVNLDKPMSYWGFEDFKIWEFVKNNR